MQQQLINMEMRQVQINWGTNGFKILSFLAVSASLLFANSIAIGEIVVFSEDWETPEITTDPLEVLSGLFIPIDRNLPPNWTAENNLPWLLSRPATARFSQSSPFAAPAGGDQALILEGRNTGVSIEVGAIAANTAYTLSAAIGSALNEAEENDTWSLQLWSDTSGDGTVTADDLFLGQSFGTLAGVTNPVRGGWATNSVTIDSSDTPDAVGSDLLIFLNNFSIRGTSYYDNVSLSSTSSVPEPNAVFVFGLTGAMLALARRRTTPKGAGY